MSDDGRQGITLIALLGSVFSPYYAHARRHGAADPLNHCTLNVAVYGATGRRWSCTERGRRAIQRDVTTLAIGPSSLHWDGVALSIDIDEVTAPLPSRIRGRVRVLPSALCERSFALDARGLHCWSPLAPHGRVEVELQAPALRWSGSAYLDSNAGERALELDFNDWTWARSATTGATTVLYDVARRSGESLSLALRFDSTGGCAAFAAPPLAKLQGTVWRLARAIRADAGSSPQVLRTLEDGPFYARSIVRTQMDGAPLTAIHESLSLQRFQRRWVQLLLPFRMPRRR